MDNKIKLEIKALVEKLNQWNYEYYVLDKPTVSDFQYTIEMERLIDLENRYPEFKNPNSPTQKIGNKVVDKFTKYTHEYKMYSLDNAFDKEDLNKFFDDCEKEINQSNIKQQPISYVCELKIDGLSISIDYENGHFVRAVTRGDGFIGEDVSENVKTIRGLPLVIDCKDKITVRGEIFLPIEEFHRINEQLEKEEKDLFANCRNAAAGSIRQLDASICAKRKLDYFLYSLANWNDVEIKTQDEALKFFESQKLKTNKDRITTSHREDVFAFVDKWLEERHHIDYETDGIVIKVSDFNQQEIIGYTSKFPKSQIAYKFPEEIATTKLIDIVMTVGRTGKITYNARLEPVSLCGTIVQNATLHNADYITTKDIRIGDIVRLKKAAEIIPKVIEPVLEERKSDLPIWEECTECYLCKSTLVRQKGEVDQYCLNIDCKARILESLTHFCSRKAMNIEGLSDKIIQKFYENGLIRKIDDIYSLPEKGEIIKNLENFGDKSFNNLVESINKSKSASLDKLLFGLGIRHVGEKTAKVMARYFSSIDNLAIATKWDLEKIKDVGEEIIASTLNWFKNEENVILINNLRSYGLNLKYISKINHDLAKNSSFFGKNIVITGTLSQPRNHFKDKLESIGANVSNTVTKNTDYLLVGEDAGSKLEKARKFSVKILSENDYNEIMAKTFEVKND